jgi:2'-5' RNA ligase
VAEAARVFFAVWPAPPARRALAELAAALRAECGGRAVPADNIHLTLVFLGDVGRACLPEIEALAGTVDAPRFDLEIERVEYWRHNRILWAGVTHCPQALAGLVSALERALQGQGLRPDPRPYVPHVTLVREARRAPTSGVVPPIAWPVEEFALVESAPAGGSRHYRVLRRWALAQ